MVMPELVYSCMDVQLGCMGLHVIACAVRCCEESRM